MSVAAHQATCSLTSNRCMLPSRRMTSRRSGERIPPAISVRLTTLMARGPEDCRACTSQSRAAVFPRRCSISTSLSTRITHRPVVPGNSYARPARGRTCPPRPGSRRTRQWQRGRRRDPRRGARRSPGRSVRGSVQPGKHPLPAQPGPARQPGLRRGKCWSASYTTSYTAGVFPRRSRRWSLRSGAMPQNRMNREEFFAKLAPLDAEQRGKILWNLYWRGTAAARERIEGELDPPERERRQHDAATPPDPALVLAEVSQFVELARSGAYIAGDRRVSRTERTKWRATFRQLATDALLALHAADTAPGEQAMELMIDLARDAEGSFRSEDPLERSEERRVGKECRSR